MAVKYTKGGEVIAAKPKASIAPTDLGTGYLSDAAKKAAARKKKQQDMLDEISK